MQRSASRWVKDLLLTKSVPVRASYLRRPTSHRGCHVASSLLSRRAHPIEGCVLNAWSTFAAGQILGPHDLAKILSSTFGGPSIHRNRCPVMERMQAFLWRLGECLKRKKTRKHQPEGQAERQVGLLGNPRPSPSLLTSAPAFGPLLSGVPGCHAACL